MYDRIFEHQISTPEAGGIPSQAIVEFLDALEAKAVPMHGFLAMRGGKILAEGYWKPFDRDYLHRVYSCSKSVTSIAIGMLESEGVLSLDDVIAEYFTELLPEGGLHPYFSGMTVRDLLKMSSPYSKAVYKSEETDDITRLFFNHRPSHIAGTVFSYDTSATHTLAALVEKTAGMPLLNYLRPRLLDPLGISGEAYCMTDPTGVSFGGSGMFCTLRDLAGLAFACMRGGKINGRQLIPEAYIRQATSPQISNFVSQTHMDSEYGYGYQFWCYPGGAFAFIGMGGQCAFCFPKQDFLVCTQGDSQIIPGDTEVIREVVVDKLLPYLDGGQKPSPGLDELRARLGNLSFVTVKGKYDSPRITELDARTYILDKNRMRWENVSVHFSGDGGALRFVKNGAGHEINFGCGKNAAGKFPEYGWDCLASAAWWDENTLNLACYIIGECFAPLRCTLYFKGDAVTVQMRNAANRFIFDYNGYASGYSAARG